MSKNYDDDLNEFNKKYSHYLNDSDDDFEETHEELESTQPLKFEDISSYSDENAMNESHDTFRSIAYDDSPAESENEAPEDEHKGNFFTRNKHRNTKIIAVCLAALIVLSVAGVLIYYYVISKSDGWKDDGVNYNDNFNADDYLNDDNHDFQAMGDVDASSLNDFLYKWANNGGEKMYNKNVINVLLCGVDSTSGTAASGRSDSMILISVNKKTEKITMVSLLRDSWTYIKVPKSNGTTYDYYFKMNAAYNLGGPATLLETIENNFKVEIDQYIAVDFNSFPKLIDALGGVTVEVQDYEASYIRRTSSQTNFPSGVAKLSGKQALIYSRIRHSDGDSDVSRTRRQRTVIKALISSAKTATNGQLVNAFKQVSGYMRTGYSQSEVLSLLAQAYSHNWMSFEMTELMLPNEDYKDRLSTYVGDQSAWVVDYALCAQKLQKALYGETNIVLSADRTSALDLVTNKRTTTDSDSDSGSGSGSGSSSGSGSGSGSYYSTTGSGYNSYDDDDDDNDYTSSSTSRYTTSKTEEYSKTTSSQEENVDEE